MVEKINRAAIMFDGEVWSVPQPGRHNNIVRNYCRHHNVAQVCSRVEEPSVQGFVTSAGRFVDRKEAAKIAFEAKQITKPKPALFSEDVW